MINAAKFSGLYTALITPFKAGKIDEKALEKLIEFQIKNGADGIVPCGTTGESPTLLHQEHNFVIERCVQIANKRIKVLAGTGSNSTREAIEMTNHASKIGADGALIITPYYNKPTQRGLIEHYTSIHNNTNIDIVIYNVPGRTSINIEDKTISELANLQRISGVKDATGDLARVYILKSMLPKNKPFSILSGEDMTVVPFNAAGGHGVISVTSNILPNMCKQIQSLSLSSKIKEANELQSSIITLNNLLFKETNPIVIKWVCSLVGLCEKEIRLPLTQPSEALQEAVKVELAKLSVI